MGLTTEEVNEWCDNEDPYKNTALCCTVVYLNDGSCIIHRSSESFKDKAIDNFIKCLFNKLKCSKVININDTNDASHLLIHFALKRSKQNDCVYAEAYYMTDSDNNSLNKSLFIINLRPQNGWCNLSASWDLKSWLESSAIGIRDLPMVLI